MLSWSWLSCYLRLPAIGGQQDLSASSPSKESRSDVSYAERILRFRGFNKWKQASLRIIASMLPESENNAAREFFLSLDTECRGQISFAAVCQACEYEHKASDEEDVTFTEFIAATFDRKRGLGEKMCRVHISRFPEL
eukprot:Skav228916  [mRNA]  locus=scaffold2504:104207:106753:+ [translate_table: standard]